VVDTLMSKCSAELATLVDADGKVPVNLAPAELLRFAEELDHLQGDEVDVGRAQKPGESVVSGSYITRGLRDGKPLYRRSDSPWVIAWNESDALWAVYKDSPDGVTAAQRAYECSAQTPRCPRGGWTCGRAGKQPEPSFEEGMPWRAGAELLRTTPAAARPDVAAMVADLPPLPPKPQAAIEVHTTSGRAGGVQVTVRLPPGAPVIEHVLEEMARRGELPTMGNGHHQCVQQ
jgi:hypothetical protein